MPWTFEGKLRTLWNKTLRWPGHFAAWKAYMDAGSRLMHAIASPPEQPKPPGAG